MAPKPNRAARRYAKMREVALYLDISERTVRAMVADGRLTAYKLGERVVRLDLDEVDAAMTPAGGAA
ncbi:DNA binding domain-containing protein [Mycolicibacterium fortuitum]|uniref:DNA binding domain-containing protein n=1 Tax=Mycolicibacterium fortuitum TaxID=1766 RepID=A0A378UZZ1_MYCFO|nr:DNA binding domain-containing protein [Mycolicibacterium fortuitum]